MTNKMDLKGKVAFIQGGSRGIGAAIAKRLAADGAAVAISYANASAKAQEVVDAIRVGGGRATAYQADSADAGALQNAIRSAAAEFGGLDILVNNAGVLALGTIDQMALDDFDRTFAINVRSVFVATQEAVRHMRDGGRVIHIGSTNAERVPFTGGATYAMSKSALVALTKGMARDLGPRGITVNNVQPGPVDTDMNPDSGEFAASLKAMMALPRYGQVEEIADFVAYLASPGAGYITGANLSIDGGFSA